MGGGTRPGLLRRGTRPLRARARGDGRPNGRQRPGRARNGTAPGGNERGLLPPHTVSAASSCPVVAPPTTPGLGGGPEGNRAEIGPANQREAPGLGQFVKRG